jgi:hypothetical protein
MPLECHDQSQSPPLRSGYFPGPQLCYRLLTPQNSVLLKSLLSANCAS